uniref:C-X-C motif chemokine n=1 Tax=Falco tinnunculus TaxID=100819 RepID=A0A8C4UVP3_FALTI
MQVLKLNVHLSPDVEDKGLHVSDSTSVSQAHKLQENWGWATFIPQFWRPPDSPFPGSSRRRSPGVPGVRGSWQASAATSPAPLAGELRCRCLRTVSQVIPPRRLARVQLLAEGPHCAVPEVIATTKQGQTLCLDPAAPWVKLILTRIHHRYQDNSQIPVFDEFVH